MWIWEEKGILIPRQHNLCVIDTWTLRVNEPMPKIGENNSLETVLRVFIDALKWTISACLHKNSSLKTMSRVFISALLVHRQRTNEQSQHSYTKMALWKSCQGVNWFVNALKVHINSLIAYRRAYWARLKSHCIINKHIKATRDWRDCP